MGIKYKTTFETKIAKNALERELLRSIEKFNLENKILLIINGMNGSNSAIVFPTKEELDSTVTELQLLLVIYL